MISPRDEVDKPVKRFLANFDNHKWFISAYSWDAAASEFMTKLGFWPSIDELTEVRNV